MKVRYNVKESLFADYDTVIFDLDKTIWECFDARGTSIPAFKMEPPFELVDEGLVKDIRENLCRLQPNFKDVLASLDDYGLNLGVVSRSALEDVSDEAQPAKMLIGKLDILRYFTYLVVIKAGIDKGDYARPDGRTLFIDDDQKMLQAVNTRGLVDVLSRTKFMGWEKLFTSSKAERPRPATVQQFTNAPQPTTSSWRTADDKTYTDKSDIDGGIGGGARNMAEMWHMEDHLELDNGRDHVWGEPLEPQKQYFLDETAITPMVMDKIREQHPDKGGIAVSSLSLGDQQIYEKAMEIAQKLRVSYAHILDQEILNTIFAGLKIYYDVTDNELSRSTEIIKQALLNSVSDAIKFPSPDNAFLVGDDVDVEDNPDTMEFRGNIERLPTVNDDYYLVRDMEDNVWGIEKRYITKVGAAGSPGGEQYPDYMGNTDVSPKDPKHQDELEEPSSIRKDLERQYFETGLHSTPERPETMRPLTPFASHGDEPAVNPEIHRPNTILVHEGVLQALTFAESIKPRTIVNHEAREDYRYVAPQHS